MRAERVAAPANVLLLINACAASCRGDTTCVHDRCAGQIARCAAQ